MSDMSPEEVGKSLMDAQAAIHTVPAGWSLSAAVAEFGEIMQSWAQHPKGRNWNLVSDLSAFIESVNKRNNPSDEQP